MKFIANLIRAARSWKIDRDLKRAGVPTMAEFYAAQGR